MPRPKRQFSGLGGAAVGGSSLGGDPHDPASPATTYDESGDFISVVGCAGDAEVISASAEADLIPPLIGGVPSRRRIGTAISRPRIEIRTEDEDAPRTHRIEQLWVTSENGSSMSARLRGRCGLSVSLVGSSTLKSALLVLERPNPQEEAELLSMLNFIELVE